MPSVFSTYSVHLCSVRFLCPGVPLLDGGTVRLPAIVGLSRALDLVLTGRPVDAKEALQMGGWGQLCSEVQ